MVAITGYYANLTRSVKLKPCPGGPKSYLSYSPSAHRALSHALTVSFYMFLLKAQVFHLGYVDLEAAGHSVLTIEC